MIGHKRSYGGYLIQRARRRLINSLYRRLYRDDAPDQSRCLMLAGTARTGTTWLAELIGSNQPTRIMFEPFHPAQVPDYASFKSFLFMRPDEPNAALHDYCDRVFTGRIRNPWIDDMIEVLRPQARIVKDVRANLLLKWINRQFPSIPLVLLLRHPCAVAHSRMELRWPADQDLSCLTSQKNLKEDFLRNKEDLINGAQYEEEKNAVIWCIHNMVPLSQFGDGGLNVVRYEDLLSNKAEVMAGLMQSIGWQGGDAVNASPERPSRTTSLSTALDGALVANSRWKNNLSVQQIDRIFKVVDMFGLGHLYQQD